MDKAKEAIVQKLKASGCRITKQRLMLLDIILEENCSCCKEIYYRASRIDPLRSALKRGIPFMFAAAAGGRRGSGGSVVAGPAGPHRPLAAGPYL